MMASRPCCWKSASSASLKWARVSDTYLRVGQYDGDLLALTLDVVFGEGTEVDIRLELRIDGDGYLTVAEGHLDIEATFQHRALQAQHVVVGYNLVDMIFGCVELGAFLHLGDEQGNGINPLHCGSGL